jgi:hypothetical protein
MDRSNGEQNGEEIAALGLLISEFHDGAQLFSCQVFDTTSEASGINSLCYDFNYYIIFILHIHGFIKIMGSI